MAPRRLVTLAALVASACLAAFAAQAQTQTASEASPDDDARGQHAASPPATTGRTDELQRQFWRCDHATTRRVLDFHTAAQCSLAYEELLRLRFGGDSGALLAWWRAHKAAEHAALERGMADAARARAAPEPVALAAGPLDHATPEQLKAAYLHCDAIASTELFHADAAHACSIVFEALKARVFGGSTDRFIAWLQHQHAALGDRARPGQRR
jgi:hypothetical protein